MPVPATKTYDCVVTLKGDLPEALKAEAPDADFWAYASVETKDRDGDLVRVKGIRLSSHRAESPVKLLAGHLRTLPNGESPVIGKVLGFKQVTHKDLNVPALAFAGKFASTPLGKHYKTLHDDGCVTDFSIGFRVHKAEPIADGFDYTDTELVEISSVSVPANQHASVMRALTETYPETKADDAIITLLKSILENTKSLSLRLDDIESAVEGTKADPEGEPTARTTTPPQTATFDPADIAALKSLAARL